ncbi:MAG: NADH-quinone oxidoreductase subunit J [Actinomycetota bacterium]
MSPQEWTFAVLAFVGVIAAFRVVSTRNVVHGALYLVVTLAMVGGVYLDLAAEFLAWVQIVIYVGAIVVLLLFSLMLTKAPIGRDTLDNQQRGLAAVVGAAVLGGLLFLVTNAFSGERIHPSQTTTSDVGTSIFKAFVVPFEVVSILLLAALIGAIALARKEDA